MTEFTGFKYEDLEIGQAHETVHEITADDIQRFAEVSGDFNPLHMSDEYAATTMFEKRIAHGALTASYISGILGNNLPGPGAIFVGLNMRFRRPVYIGDTVTARATVAEKIDRGNRIVLKIECIVDGKRVITGDAEVVAPSREA
ncbi:MULTISPECIES: MaoC family dehydratase [Hyphomonas]|uniref:MaoC domain-containing protein n=2 Tax=Hyphomonas adhaerens TaxID=81029 RepID=A0A069E162_9PROT|nr:MULTISPECIES: MaoC family dehydratase [Hyphomonas]KCZ83200.1 MaoC domain-containing protein [Hyphomonas adhaerens MHS-3]MBB40622.1 (R)-hydratase [Hyphomonas sp.]HAE28776.1 (R)-hydratase [Hyphomonas adhaerens]|tara:strand:+ start:208 stop:639 length:432 start_codon:yes stop_codon:yes gene_type:complete